MFAKLLKYEWRSNRNILGILSIIALGIGVVGGVDLRMFQLLEHMPTDSDIAELLLVWTIMILIGGVVFCLIALGIYTTAVSVILLYRFYKHNFTDEGYLTFTLPVSSTQIYWASFLNMLLWSVISAAVVMVSVYIALVIGDTVLGPILIITPGEVIRFLTDTPWGEVFYGIGQVFRGIGDALFAIWTEGYIISALLSVATGIMGLFSMVLSPIFGLVIPMFCIILGAVVVKRYKLITSIGIYYVVSSVIGMVSYMASMLPSFMMVFTVSMDGYTFMLFLFTLVQTVLMLGLTVAGYIASVYMMKRKLNLP